MWDNSFDSEQIEKKQLEYDKMSAVGLKKLRIVSALDIAVLLLHIASTGIMSAAVIIIILSLMMVCIYALAKDLDIGFYSFCAATLFSTASFIADCYKIIPLIALALDDNTSLDMLLEVAARSAFMICYLVTVKYLFTDKHIHCWKNFRRSRQHTANYLEKD